MLVGAYNETKLKVHARDWISWRFWRLRVLVFKSLKEMKPLTANYEAKEITVQTFMYRKHRKNHQPSLKKSGGYYLCKGSLFKPIRDVTNCVVF